MKLTSKSSFYNMTTSNTTRDDEFCENCGSQQIFRTKTKYSGTFCESCFKTLVPTCATCKTVILHIFNKVVCEFCDMPFCTECYLIHKSFFESYYNYDDGEFIGPDKCPHCKRVMCVVPFSKCKVCSKQGCERCITCFCEKCWTILICKRLKTFPTDLIKLIIKELV